VAKYTVTRSCGHEEVVALFGPNRDREWRLENVEPNKLCYECYQIALVEQREKANREAAEAAKEMALPALTGSEKQIAWAETIRQKLMTDLDEFIFRSIKKERRNDPQILAALDQIKRKTEARWWIDHRNVDVSYEFRNLLEEAAKEVKNEQMKPAPEVIAEAKTEATVRPENSVTETVAEIRALENSIEIVFPEKRDDFRGLVKQDLKMKWDGKWVRKLSGLNGSPINRAAEAGHRLLTAGFIIRIFDENIRQKAISGDYKPECTRWILVIAEGSKHAGWFAIKWNREKDDFYKASRALKSSRWSNPYTVVPPEQFEEVLDFADMYGFKLDKNARKVADAARQAKDNALIARVEAPKEQESIVTRGKPPVLDVPTGVGVADEFKD